MCARCANSAFNGAFSSSDFISDCKKRWIISKDVNTFVFDISFGGIAHDRPNFNIDDSSADKWYFDRLVMTSDEVNGKMAFRVKFCSFFLWVFTIDVSNCLMFWLIDFVRIWKSSDVTKLLTLSACLSSCFSIVTFSLICFDKALLSERFLTALVSFAFAYGILKHKYFGKTKIHVKDSCPLPPFRPIVSSIGSYNYQLAKYLCNLLTAAISYDHCTKDSFRFADEMQKVRYPSLFMVSFDLESLFPKIPLAETINLAVDATFKNNPNLKIS